MSKTSSTDSARQFARLTGAIGRYARAADGLARELAPYLTRDIQNRIRHWSQPPNAPLTQQLKGRNNPLVNTGELRASITHKVQGSQMIIGTNKVYAPLVHNGGVIRPKKADTLMIPATRKIRRLVDIRGVRGTINFFKESLGADLHWTPKSLIGSGGVNLRDYGVKLTQQFDDAGNALPQGYLLFVRKRAVTVPARPFLRLTRAQRQALIGQVRTKLRKTLQ